MRKFSFIGIVALTALRVTSTEVLAGHEMKTDKEPVPVVSPFDKGRMEFQAAAGAFSSFGNFSDTRPHLVDVDVSLRLGWMLNTPSGDGFFRGNCEFFTELFGAAVVEGPGSGFGGLTLLLRYNFVQPDSRCVPYFQIGAGGLYNDVHESSRQHLFGSPFEFNLQGGFGVRCFVAERCAIFLEADYRHISNAGLSDRNAGMNSVGGYIGASYFF